MADEFRPQNRWTQIYGKLKSGALSKFQGSGSALASKLNWKDLANRLQSIDLQKSVDWVSQKVQDSNFAFYGKLATIVVSSYFLADLSALVVGDYLPTSTNLGKKPRSSLYQGRDRQAVDYQAIVGRNLFSSKGLIPGDEEGGPADSNAAPIKTGLPLALVGTLIMSNPIHSLATIEDKAASQIFPVAIDDEIPGKLKVVSIEARKVIFINKMSGRKEYVDLPEDQDGPRIQTRPISGLGSGAGAGIEKISPTQFSVARGEVDRALGDFNNLITQARADPYRENGLPAGFKLSQIIPGSLYDKLGLQNGDVISGLNGQVVNDVGQALQLFNELKTMNHVELQIKKDGRTMNYVYEIHP